MNKNASFLKSRKNLEYLKVQYTNKDNNINSPQTILFNPDFINYLGSLLGRFREISAKMPMNLICRSKSHALLRTYRRRNLDSPFKCTTFRSDQTACEWNDLLVCLAS